MKERNHRTLVNPTLLAVALGLLLGTLRVTWNTAGAQTTRRCLPSAHPTGAPPLLPTPGLSEGDAAYQLALAADPGPITTASNPAAARASLIDLTGHAGAAHRAYRNAAAARPNLTSTAYTRIGDLQDLLATRGRELVAAEHHWTFDNPRLGRDVCHMYCVAAVSYRIALHADPTNARAESQLASYGPHYRTATAHHCPD